MKTKITFASVAGIGLAVLFLGGFLAIALPGCSGPPVGSDAWRKAIFASAPDAPPPAPVVVRP